MADYPIRIVGGNWFRLIQPLEKIEWQDSEQTVTDYEPSPNDDIKVTLIGSYSKCEMKMSNPKIVDGNKLQYENNGTVALGVYGVEVKIVCANGARLRSYQDNIVKIVKTNKEASIPDSTEFGIDTYLIDGAVFLYIPSGEGGGGGGQDGVGIRSITQTSSSQVSCGDNEITCTLTNGEVSRFYIKNGSQGAPGSDGNDGNPGTTPTITATASVTNTTGTPSVNVTKSGTTEAPVFNFSFSGIKGEPGADGNDGAPGADGSDGSDGVSSYIHIKYSDDGSTFSSSDGDTPGDYLGILVDNNSSASSTFADYTWYLIKGADGSNADAPKLYIGTSTNWGTSASGCALRPSYFLNAEAPTKAGDLVFSTSNGNLHRCNTITYDSNLSAYKTNPTYLCTVLVSHQSITDKADKVQSATNGHLAGLNSNGNLTDSGFAIWVGTESAYNAIPSPDSNTLYFIKEATT